MQEKFRKTIKKVAAIGTGIAMLGMTLTGAMAATDLSGYPSGFGGTDTIIVVGANAGDSAKDNMAASYIAAGLPASGTTSIGGNVISGGVDDNVPIGYNICAKNHLDCQQTNDNIESLQDTQISFHSSDYDVHEELDFNQKHNVSLVSSLGSLVVGSGVEDDYESNLFLEVGAQNAIRYYYAFDDAINVSLDVSTTNPLKIKFLGKTLKIISTDSTTPNSKFTAYVGNEYFLNQGESVVVDGKTVTLDNVGSGGAIALSVDGVKEVISSGNTETINGIEVTNDETFYTSAGKSETAASLVIGKDASSTIKNGDYYPGGNEVCSNNDPADPDCWRWIVSGLASGSSTTINVPSNGSDLSADGTILGIQNYFIINDDSDNPPGVGDCISLPNGFVSICLDSLTVSDDDYMNLKISYDTSASFIDAYPLLSSQNAIKISTSEAEGLRLMDGTFIADNLTKDTKTDTVWLELSTGDDALQPANVRVFYENANNQIRLAGNLSMNRTNDNFMEINYKDTKSTNIAFDLHMNSSTANNVNLSLDILGDEAVDLPEGVDDIMIRLSHAANGVFRGLGTAANSEESLEIEWNGTVTPTYLGTKDEDHRTMYGIIIRDPKSHGSSDEVEMDIPGNQVMGKVVVSGSVVQKATDSSTTSSLIKFDNEVTDIIGKNVILVGGPCANSLTAQVTGASAAWPACAEGFTDGEAIIELKPNGDKYALIAAGYSADDTIRAGLVLKSYQEKLGSAVAGKSKVIVTGTGLEVSGIIVA